MNRTRVVWTLTLPLLLGLLVPATSDAEWWDSFSKLIGESDYIAQYQVLERTPAPDDSKILDTDKLEDAGARPRVVGRRRVRVYWKSKDFQDRLLPPGDKPWGLADYNRKTDDVRTEFVFYGRGQHLWTAAAQRGVIQYPGDTAELGIGDEFSGSDVEFDDLLQRAAALRATGAKLEGKLETSVFGEKRLCK